MTTLRDILNDFQTDTKNLILAREDGELTDEQLKETEQDLIDAYIDSIKERIIG